MKVGTPEHRDLFCRTFIDGHREYEPENLPWPQLAPNYLERLRAIPFWGIARAMERKAGIMVAAFAQSVADPMIREAIAIQGIEEARHARLMSHFIERYDLHAGDIEIGMTENTKDAFVAFGYEECLDFFMGAGLFRLSAQFDFFPADLTAIFDEVLFEEARHVTFFINWYRYEEARAGRDGRFSRHLTAARNYLRSVRHLVRSFSGVEMNGFAASGAKELVADVTPVMFLEAALAEHRRRLGLLDRRLVKPALLSGLGATLLTLLRALPPRLAEPALLTPQPVSVQREADVAA